MGMKRCLITGANSYIGMSFEKYMAQWPDDYQVETVDMRGEEWRKKDFSGYDVIYHVAGIAHIKETPENAHLYYEVNRDLVLETAKKAKAEGVRQFIFLSSMSVYGIDEGAISLETPTNPKSNYGKSKIQAEEGLTAFRSENFRIAVMRPPMVYGDGCKGNYQSLIKFARKMPFFPDYQNKRSMIHIDRLCWFVKQLIDHCSDGLFLPQDREYVCTCKMVQQIAESMGKQMRLVKCLNPLVSVAKRCTTPGRKAFGDLYYEKTETSQGEIAYEF